MHQLKQGLLYPNLPPHIQLHTDDDNFLRYMDCTTTAATLEDAIYDLTLEYRNGAPINDLGYPLTHGYNHGTYMAHDPVPALTTISRGVPYDAVPHS